MSKRFALVLLFALAGCAGAGTASDPDKAVAEAVEPSLRAAAAAEANRDHKGAIQHLSTLYQRRSDDKGIAVALARNLRYSGQAQNAADIIQAQLTRLPNDPDLLLELGKDYLAAERVALAIKALEQARAATPDRWEAHATLGVALDTQGRGPEALSAYGRAAQLSPDNPVVLNNLALSQAIGGRLDEALATISRAADLPTATAQVRQNLALLLALKGDGAAAERLARHDLPPDMAKNNVEVLRALAVSSTAR